MLMPIYAAAMLGLPAAAVYLTSYDVVKAKLQR
jgi:hypothetical protein